MRPISKKNETINNNNWLKVKLVGVASNKDGIGNRIEVFANGKSQYRYTLFGEGYLGQNSSYEFFGLADATSIETIKVTWNKTGIVETIQNVAINSAITIKEGSGVLNLKSIAKNEVKLYPNPSSNGLFTISLFNENSPNFISVFDYSGRKILYKKETKKISEIDLSNVAPGIYFVRISSNKKQQLLKIIKN